MLHRRERIGRGRSTTSIRAHKLPAGTPKYLRTRPKDSDNVALRFGSVTSGAKFWLAKSDAGSAILEIWKPSKKMMIAQSWVENNRTLNQRERERERERVKTFREMLAIAPPPSIAFPGRNKNLPEEMVRVPEESHNEEEEYEDGDEDEGFGSAKCGNLESNEIQIDYNEMMEMFRAKRSSLLLFAR
ncbi:hypothetical protein F2Q69_00032259 [Brassica cretica]|uniref:Uncharacterized protein n=1 Tax=Brassica cretica TaxID=69181 RepID=A0A8S9S0Y7_BRACR|nr:hypothetical protein F2Q69_00032259 [Brassica cretica]